MLLNPYRFYIPSGIYDPDAEALFLRMTVQPPEPLKVRIHNLITGLKFYNVWQKLDALLIPKGLHTSQAGCLDWKRIDKLALLQDGAVWSKGAGFEGDGVSAYVNTLFAPSVDGVNFTLNNFGIGCYITEIDTVSVYTNRLFGSRQNINKYLSMTVSTTGSFSAELCSGNELSSSSSISYNGFHHGNRTSSSTAEIFRNALSLFSTNNNASAGLPSLPVYLLAIDLDSIGGRSNVKIGCWYAGSSLTTIEQTAFNQLLEEFWLPDFSAENLSFPITQYLEVGPSVIQPIEYITPTVELLQVNYI